MLIENKCFYIAKKEKNIQICFDLLSLYVEKSSNRFRKKGTFQKHAE